MRPSTTEASSPAPTGAFRLYLAVAAAAVAVLLPALLQSLSPAARTPSAYFQSLPLSLRLHHSSDSSRFIPVRFPDSAAAPINLFVSDVGPRDSSHRILILPGLACSSFSFQNVSFAIAGSDRISARVVSLDLPGSGFSDGPSPQGNFLLKAFREMREKGVFWAFDHLVETGNVPYQQVKTEATEPYSVEQMVMVIAQVVDVLGLAPVHLVLHDAALAAGAGYAALYPSNVRSVVVIDAVAGLPAFPSLLLAAPLVGDVLVRSRMLFTGLLRLCCSRVIDDDVADVHRILLLGNGKKMSVAETGKTLRYRFDLEQLWNSVAAKDIPVLALWSSSWSDRWIDEARKVSLIPGVAIAYHTGGRWPQVDAAEEISESILQFVTSLPRSTGDTMKEPVSDHLSESVLS